MIPQSDEIIDIDLGDGQDFFLDSSNDLAVAKGNAAIIFGLVRRILVQRGSWAADPTFGSEMHTLLSSQTVQEVSEDQIRDMVLDAATPMLADGRIDEIIDSTIIKRNFKEKSITIKIIARIGTDVLQVELTNPQ